MKQTIRLNERELHRLINESVKRVINENNDDGLVVNCNDGQIEKVLELLSDAMDIINNCGDPIFWELQDTYDTIRELYSEHIGHKFTTSRERFMADHPQYGERFGEVSPYGSAITGM